MNVITNIRTSYLSVNFAWIFYIVIVGETSSYRWNTQFQGAGGVFGNKSFYILLNFNYHSVNNFVMLLWPDIGSSFNLRVELFSIRSNLECSNLTLDSSEFHFWYQERAISCSLHHIASSGKWVQMKMVDKYLSIG